MNIRFVSQDLAWTDSMKKSVHRNIIEPLAGVLKHEDFEISVHLDIGWTRKPNLAPRFELWMVLQTFDGRQNALVRRAGSNFSRVADAVSQGIRQELERLSRPHSYVHL